jgi:CheY-like chemotaxis protein
MRIWHHVTTQRRRLQMPVIDGYEATRQIKADPSLAQISNRRHQLVRHEGRRREGRRLRPRYVTKPYVTKPYSPIELLHIIRGYLGDKA